MEARIACCTIHAMLQRNNVALADPPSTLGSRYSRTDLHSRKTVDGQGGCLLASRDNLAPFQVQADVLLTMNRCIP